MALGSSLSRMCWVSCRREASSESNSLILGAARPHSHTGEAVTNMHPHLHLHRPYWDNSNLLVAIAIETDVLLQPNKTHAQTQRYFKIFKVKQHGFAIILSTLFHLELWIGQLSVTLGGFLVRPCRVLRALRRTLTQSAVEAITYDFNFVLCEISHIYQESGPGCWLQVNWANKQLAGASSPPGPSSPPSTWARLLACLLCDCAPEWLWWNQAAIPLGFIVFL